MSATTESGASLLARTRDRDHPMCFICSRGNEHGLGVRFELAGAAGVEARFACGRAHEGYPGLLHGGVIASLLDGAMLHCLFAQGRSGVTAELNLQFRHPVRTERPVTVRARLVECSGGVCMLAAELLQDGRLMARGTGRFRERQAMESTSC